MGFIPRSGNEAVAEAMKQINPAVVAAYPITPQTEIMHHFSKFVADGIVDTEYIAAESEHSAMSACIGAAVAGVRTMTATASQGLALMWELLYIASGLRLPIVLINVNRTLSAPINIHGEHSDSFGARDSGFIQIYSENIQEAYDHTILAVKIAETCSLPVMVNLDGFITSHCVAPLQLIKDEVVKEFIGEFKPRFNLLDTKNPITIGSIVFTDYFFEAKYSQIMAISETKDKIKKILEEFSRISQRDYDIFEIYKAKNKPICVLTLSSTAGSLKSIIKDADNIGLIKLRFLRPFFADELKEILKDYEVVGIVERCDSLSGCGGPLSFEVKSALYELEKRPKIVDFITGLGGRDVSELTLKEICQKLKEIRTLKEYPKVNYVGLRHDILFST